MSNGIFDTPFFLLVDTILFQVKNFLFSISYCSFVPVVIYKQKENMRNPPDDSIGSINRKGKKGWEFVYDRYYQSLCSYANRYVNDPEVVQDIVQDILVKVWQADNAFPVFEAFVTYLYKSVYINSLLYLRTKNKREGILQRVAEETEKTDERLLADIVMEEVIRQLHRCVEELPSERREVMRLSLKGYSVSEIAEMLDVSVSTVKTQRQRSFSYLKEKLKDFYCIIPLFFN